VVSPAVMRAIKIARTGLQASARSGIRAPSLRCLQAGMSVPDRIVGLEVAQRHRAWAIREPNARTGAGETSL